MQVLASLPAAPEAATRFLQFVNASPTPFHAVHNAALRLERAGFRKVCQRPSLRRHVASTAYRSERKMIGRLPFSRVVNITSRGEPLYLPIKHGYAVSLCRPLPAPLGTKVPCSPSQSRKTGNLELASP